MDNRYRLHISSVGRSMPGIIVGSVRERAGDRLVCDIYLDDEKVYRAGALAAAAEMYGSEPRMYITSIKLEALQTGNDDEKFEIYHELGHIELGHYAVESEEEAQTRFEREELEADAFAADILGKELCERVLRTQLKNRVEADKMMGRQGTAASIKAVREIRRRIDALK